MKFSRCIALQHPDREAVARFYGGLLGNTPREDAGAIELAAGTNKLFIDQGEQLGPILEFLVPNLDQARDALVGRGCQIVRWEGKGGCCYLRDPFGFMFNLYEDPAAFGDA